APKMTNSFVMLRVLAGTDDDLLADNYRRGDEVALGAATAELILGILGIGVELPDQLAGLRLEGIEPAVAAGKDDLRLAVDYPVRRIGPLAVHDCLARRAILPLHLAGLFVEGEEARRLRRRNVNVPFIDAVGRHHEQSVAGYQSRAGRHIVREDIQV